jgi:hypothetical protein
MLVEQSGFKGDRTGIREVFYDERPGHNLRV